MSEPSSPAPQSAADSPTRWTFAAIAAGYGLLCAYLYQEVWADDYFITFRYVDNFMHHHVIGYNAGQRDEGLSDILFVVLIAAARAVTRIPIYPLIKLVGLALALPAFVLVHRLLRRFVPVRAWLLPAMVLIAADAAMAIYAVLGVSNTLFLATMFGALVCFVEGTTVRIGPRRVPVYPLLVLANMYTRQEGILLALAIAASLLVVSYVRERSGVLGALRGAARRHGAELLLLGGCLAVFLLFKLLYFGHLASPPSLRKATRFEDITGDYVLDNLGNIAARYWFLVPGTGLFFLSRRAWRDQLPFTIVAGLLVAAHLVLRVALQPDTGRYFNQLAVLLYVVAFAGYFWAFEAVSQQGPEQREQALVVASIVLVGVLGLQAWRLRDAVADWHGLHDRLPVDFAYIPAGKFVKEHSCEQGSVASSEAGAPAYFSERRFVDTSGLTDYRFARVWRETPQLADEAAYGELVGRDPAAILTIPSLKEYYRLFFEANPDFVFVIANPPSYVLAIHPDFQRRYAEVWRKQREDDTRGYYALFANVRSPCVRNVDLSEVVVNDMPRPRPGPRAE